MEAQARAQEEGSRRADAEIERALAEAEALQARGQSLERLRRPGTRTPRKPAQQP
jgi:hypothetical protein